MRALRSERSSRPAGAQRLLRHSGARAGARRARAEEGRNPAWGGGGGGGRRSRGQVRGASRRRGDGAERQKVAAGGCGAAGKAGHPSFPPLWAWLLGAQVLRDLAGPASTAAEGSGRIGRASGESRRPGPTPARRRGRLCKKGVCRLDQVKGASQVGRAGFWRGCSEATEGGGS